MNDDTPSTPRPPKAPAAKRRKTSKPAAKATKAKPAAAAESPVAQSVTDEATPAGALFAVEMDVRWRDLDAFNHVNNANFLTYIEEARLAWLQSLAGPWFGEHSAPVLAAAQVNYRRPIPWPERLRVELQVQRVGSSSLTLGHRIVSAADATVLYGDGHTVMVWVDGESGRTAPLPDAVRQAAS